MNTEKSSLGLFWLTFRSAIKGNFIFPLLNLIALIIIIPVYSSLSMKTFISHIKGSGSNEMLSAKITDYYKYFIIDSGFDICVLMSVIVCSILLGIMIFRFLTSKKTVNVFYSLGISRNNLFVSNYLAGLLMLFITITIPFLISLFMNISVFGSSSELRHSIVYNIIGFSVLSMITFSVTAAVLSCVGTIIEGIAFTSVILAGPTAIYFCIETLIEKLTFGSPYGHFYNQTYAVTNALSYALLKYNPILFMFNYVSPIDYLYREDVKDKFIWTAPDYRTEIIWFIIAAAMFLLGMYLFKKRKVEICGFPGINKRFNFVITFLVGFSAFGYTLSLFDSLSIGLIIAAVVNCFIYLLIDLALNRDLKKWIKGLFKLPLHLGITMIIVAVFATGLFGFSSRIPSVDRIESADITPVSYSGFVNLTKTSVFDHNDFLNTVYVGMPICGFKSEKDLKIITSIHKLIIEAGRLKAGEIDYSLPADKQIARTAIKIIYHLKSGGTFSRYYNAASMKTLNTMLAIDETDRYKELIVQNYTEPITKNDSSESKESKQFFQSNSTITFIPNRTNIPKELKITSEQRSKLLKALSKDLTTQTVKQRYYPESPALGAIQFDAIDFSLNSIEETNSANIIITKDMANTLEFLKYNSFLKTFDSIDNSKFIAARVIAADTASESITPPRGKEISMHFMGYLNSDYYEDGIFEDTYIVKDEAVLNKIADNAYISYFREVAGYYVKFECNNEGGYKTMFVPASKMPQSVIDGVANFVKTK